MISELKIAIEKAGKLSEKEQKQIAQLILDEINWDVTLANSSEQLHLLANEALEEYKRHNTKPLDL